MANILLVTADTAHAAYTNTKAALESEGHAVTGALDTTTALDSAWAAGPFDLIASARATYHETIAPAWQTWVRDKWAAGTPVLLGGTEAGATSSFSALTHAGTRLGVLGSANARSWSTTEADFAVDMRIVNPHPVVTGWTVGVGVAVVAAQNYVTRDFSASVSYGTEVGDFVSGDTDYGVVLTAFEVGDPLRTGELAPAAAPARLVFCGWLYAGQSDYTADGKTIIGQAVDWLTSGAAPPPAGTLTVTLPALTADLSGTYTAPPPPTYTGDLAATLPVVEASLSGTYQAPPAGILAATLPALAVDLSGTYTAPAGAAPLGNLDATLPRLTATLAGTYTAPVEVIPTGTLDVTLPALTAALSGAYIEPTLEEATTDRVDRSNGRTRVLEWTVEVELPLVDDDGYLIREDGTPILDGNGDPVPAPPGYGGTPTRTRGHDYAIAATTPPPTLVDGRPT